MRIVLVMAALAVAVPTAAAADPRAGASGFGDVLSERGDRVRDRDDRDHRDRRDRRGRGGVLYIDAYGDGDRVSDRAFQPDSFNDWWHDRPDRAYPAWMSRNAKCERMWWSGGGWTC